MKLKAFAAHDSKLGTFMSPFFFQHTGQALRFFQEGCENPQSVMAKHPKDFQLFEVGSFDLEGGSFTSLPAPQHLCNATEYVMSPAVRAIDDSLKEKTLSDRKLYPHTV